jgi:hypothetical protein
MFAKLRTAIAAQDHPRIVHVVHQERPSDYAVADHVINGLPAAGGTAPYELHQKRLLAFVSTLEPGWVTFIDDDDTYTNPKSISTMLASATDVSVMPVWKVERERGRISPSAWQANPGTPAGALCWEAAAFHTSHIPTAIKFIDANGGSDGRMWAALSKVLRVEWVDAILTRPQREGRMGKGRGLKRDA